MEETNEETMINKKTLAALNHLVSDDTGYINEHGVHFFTIGNGEINVQLALELKGEDNFAYLSLEELSPEELMHGNQPMAARKWNGRARPAEGEGAASGKRNCFGDGGASSC